MPSFTSPFNSTKSNNSLKRNNVASTSYKVT
jgi:hypothetical protein